ncbi:MAG TPA: hypothetical protein VIK54_01145 [Acidimicrobiia bacterium]
MSGNVARQSFTVCEASDLPGVNAPEVIRTVIEADRGHLELEVDETGNSRFGFRAVVVGAR